MARRKAEMARHRATARRGPARFDLGFETIQHPVEEGRNAYWGRVPSYDQSQSFRAKAAARPLEFVAMRGSALTVALPPDEQQPELPHDPHEAREALRRHAAEAEAEAAAAAAAMAAEAMAAAADPGADQLLRVESLERKRPLLLDALGPQGVSAGGSRRGSAPDGARRGSAASTVPLVQ
jgi:hypothetical protein